MSSNENFKVWILSIGNELLIGRIVNTNASWLAKRLTFLGASINRIITVPDDIYEIVEELRRGINRDDINLIITTGGLGPTYDDKTLEAVAKALNKKLILYNEELEKIKARFTKANYPLTKEREKMAYLPEGAVALPNSVGTAPGSWIETENKKIIVSLPGVPKEMEAIFDEVVMPKLKGVLKPLAVIECGFKSVGVPESSIAPVLEEVDKKFSGIYIKSHPLGHEIKGPILEIKVLASADLLENAKRKAQGALEIVRQKTIELKGEISEEYCQ
ncbi:MAG: nicotinamide mononucleotide deamidase-related protein [Caldisphaera sp.]|nr:nicotinamide mononucleotide deamidase-related protein [Caldisphaera sp.]